VNLQRGAAASREALQARNEALQTYNEPRGFPIWRGQKEDGAAFLCKAFLSCQAADGSYFERSVVVRVNAMPGRARDRLRKPRVSDMGKVEGPKGFLPLRAARD
jgi:hypothetical protein